MNSVSLLRNASACSAGRRNTGEESVEYDVNVRVIKICIDITDIFSNLIITLR
ncbi:hypothetical protein D3C83_137720 [compost metagenome]